MPITIMSDGTSSPSLVAAAEASSGATNPRQNDGVRKIPRLTAAGAEEAYAMPEVLQAGRAETTGSNVHDLIDLFDSPAQTVGATSTRSSRPTARSPPHPRSSHSLRWSCAHSPCHTLQGGGGVSPNLPNSGKVPRTPALSTTPRRSLRGQQPRRPLRPHSQANLFLLFPLGFLWKLCRRLRCHRRATLKA